MLQFSYIHEKEGIATWYSKPLFDGLIALRPASTDTSNGKLHCFKFPPKEVTQILQEYEFRALTHLEDNTYLLATENNRL